MTTVSSVIKDALRETNLIGINATPTSAEYAEGLSRLQNIVSSVLGNEAGENLSPVLLADLCESNLPANSRLMANMTASTTLKFPKRPSDGARMAIIDVDGVFATYPLTIDGNGKNIEGASTLSLSTNSESREWFYRGDLGNWVRTAVLALDDEMPFPAEFDDIFILMLAMRLNPRNGQQMSQESIEALRRAKKQFQARYRQTTEVGSEEALVRLTTDRYHSYGFNEGTI